MNKEKLFRIVKIKKNDEDLYIIVCGHSRACKIEFETEEDAWKYIDDMGLDWDVIVTVIAELIDIIYNNKIQKK